jgi:hypothetical protein
VDETATFASEFAVDVQDPLPIGAALAGGAMKSMKVEIKETENKVANSLRIIQPF